MFTPDRILMTLESQCTLLINCYSHVQCFSVFEFLWSRLGCIKSKTFLFLSTPEHLRVIWNSSLNWHPEGVIVFKTDVESILQFLTFTDRNDWNFLSFFLSFFFLSFFQAVSWDSLSNWSLCSSCLQHSAKWHTGEGKLNKLFTLKCSHHYFFPLCWSVGYLLVTP